MERVGKRRREVNPRDSPPHPQHSSSPQPSTSTSSIATSSADLYDQDPVLPAHSINFFSHQPSPSSPTSQYNSASTSPGGSMARGRKRTAPEEVDEAIMPPKKRVAKKVRASRANTSSEPIAQPATNGDDIGVLDEVSSSSAPPSRAPARASTRNRQPKATTTTAAATQTANSNTRTTRGSRSKTATLEQADQAEAAQAEATKSDTIKPEVIASEAIKSEVIEIEAVKAEAKGADAAQITLTGAAIDTAQPSSPDENNDAEDVAAAAQVQHDLIASIAPIREVPGEVLGELPGDVKDTVENSQDLASASNTVTHSVNTQDDEQPQSETEDTQSTNQHFLITTENGQIHNTDPDTQSGIITDDDGEEDAPGETDIEEFIPDHTPDLDNGSEIAGTQDVNDEDAAAAALDYKEPRLAKETLKQAAGARRRGRPALKVAGTGKKSGGSTKTRSAAGKRKLARHWKLQAYYERQTTLRNSWRAISKVVFASNQAVNERALKKITEVDQLHFKNEAEYPKLLRELDNKLEVIRNTYEAELSAKETLEKELYERQVKYEDHVFQCRIKDLVEESTQRSKSSIVNMFKRCYQQDDDVAKTLVEDEWSTPRDIPAPTKFSCDEKGALPHSVKKLLQSIVPPTIQAATRSKTKSGRPTRSSGRSPKKTVPSVSASSQTNGKGKGVDQGDEDKDYEEAEENDDDSPQTTVAQTHGGSIMGDKPTPFNQVNDPRIMALANALRSATSTPVQGSPNGGSSAATPEPQNAVGIPAPGELLFPDRPSRSGKAAYNNRIVGLPFWGKFDEIEIGFRSIGHEGKGPLPEKAIEARTWVKELRPSPNQTAFYYDNSNGLTGRIEDYQPGDLDSDIVDAFGLHPRYGIPVTGAKNPTYDEIDPNSAVAAKIKPTDFTTPLKPTKPITFVGPDGSKFETSRSNRSLCIDKMFDDIFSNVHMVNALYAAGLLQSSPQALATYGTLGRELHLSDRAIDRLLAAAKTLESNPNAANEIEQTVRELQRAEKIAQDSASGKVPTPIPTPRRGKRALPEVATEELNTRSKRRKTDEVNTPVSTPIKEAGSATPKIQHMYPSGSGNFIQIVATGAAAVHGSAMFPPLDPTPRGHPHGLEALADMAYEHGADPNALIQINNREMRQRSPNPAQRPSRRYHSFPSAFSHVQQDLWEPHATQAPARRHEGNDLPPLEAMLRFPQMPLHQNQMMQRPQQYMGHSNHHMPPPPSPYGQPSPYGSTHHVMPPQMVHGQQQPPPHYAPPPPLIQQAPPPPPQPVLQAPRTMARGSGLRDIRPRPDAYYHAAAATLPQPYNPHLQPQHPQYQPYPPGYGRGGRGGA